MLKAFIKAVVLAVIFVITNGIDSVIAPIIANELAMQQMSNTVDSSIWIQLYTFFSNYKYWLMIAVAIITYAKEIETLFLNVKEKMKHEN